MWGASQGLSYLSPRPDVEEFRGRGTHPDILGASGHRCEGTMQAQGAFQGLLYLGDGMQRDVVGVGCLPSVTLKAQR